MIPHESRHACLSAPRLASANYVPPRARSSSEFVCARAQMQMQMQMKMKRLALLGSCLLGSCFVGLPAFAQPAPVPQVESLAVVATAHVPVLPAVLRPSAESVGSSTESQSSPESIEALEVLGVAEVREAGLASTSVDSADRREIRGGLVDTGSAIARRPVPSAAVPALAAASALDGVDLGSVDTGAVAGVGVAGAIGASLPTLTGVARRDSAARRMPSVPWIDAERLERRLPIRDSDPIVAPRWDDCFGLDLRFDEPPSYVAPLPDSLCALLPSTVPPPRRSRFSIACERVIKRKLSSEIRRAMKRNWRDHFLATPTLSYARYIGGVDRINMLGRGGDDEEFVITEHAHNEWREDVLHLSAREGERDFELLAFGPLAVMDSGSMKFELGRLVQCFEDSEPCDVLEVSVEDDESATVDDIWERRSVPVLATSSYAINTALRLGVQPLDAFRKGDPTWMINRYGFAVEIAWLSDVLGRETSRTEIEVEWERNGEFAALINFVFASN
jgi:hypothetical protein